MSKQTPDSDSEPQLDAEANPPGDPVTAMQEAEKAMEQLQKERDELFSRLARVSADYQNSMKRAEQNLTSTIDLSRGDTLRMFIPVLDHFDTALSTPAQSEDAKALAQGLQIVRDELLKVLQQAGVERVTANPGDPFDPHIHEAMLRQPAPGVKPNHVAMVLAPGYIYKKSRTLRPAKVAVAPEEETPMPTYEYRCSNCNHEMEEFQSITAKPLKKCPKCGKNALQRLISLGGGVIFKGSGFWQTEYRSDNYKKGAEAEKKSNETKTETKSDAKTETKSETKTESKPTAEKPVKTETKPAPKKKSK